MIGKNKPNIIDRYTIQGINYRTVNFNVMEVGDGYEWESIEIPLTKFYYAGIVDALVSYKYPIDKMQAVINNYLLEPENEEYVTAFNEMQAWRKESKEIAKEALLYELF